MRSGVRGTVLLLAVMWAACASAQQPPATKDVPGLARRSDQLETLRSDARLVQMDVVVLDKNGHTVTGLKPGDFTLREDGVSQRIGTFEEHTRPDADAAAAALRRAKLPPNTFSDNPPAIEQSSALVMVLDALDSPLRDQMRLRQEMIAYMKTVPAGTNIAILQLDTTLHMVQDFSGDPEQLLAGVKAKRNYPAIPALPPDYGNTRPIGIGAGDSIASFNQQNVESTGQRMQADMRGAILKDALPRIMQYLSGISGRKSVAWFYSQSAPRQAYDMSVQTQFDSDQTSFIGQMAETTSVLTLSHIALYMINIAGVGALYPNQGAIAQMAKAQGGKGYYADNDLRGIIAQVVDSSWNYYTVSYTPTNGRFDGRFRTLAIDVDKPGAQLQYRSGYFARNDDAKRQEHMRSQQAALTQTVFQPGPADQKIEGAMLLGAVAPREVLFQAHVDPSDQEKLKGKVLPRGDFMDAKYRKDKYRDYTIHYTVDTKTLRLMTGFQGQKLGGLDFVAVVFDSGGNVVNSVISKASVHADAGTFPEIERNGVQVQQTIAIPVKGNFFLRLGVHDRQADTVGALEVPVDEIKVEPAP